MSETGGEIPIPPPNNGLRIGEVDQKWLDGMLAEDNEHTGQNRTFYTGSEKAELLAQKVRMDSQAKLAEMGIVAGPKDKNGELTNIIKGKLVINDKDQEWLDKMIIEENEHTGQNRPPYTEAEKANLLAQKVRMDSQAKLAEMGIVAGPVDKNGEPTYVIKEKK